MPGYEREMGEVHAKIEHLQQTMDRFIEQQASQMSILFRKVDALGREQAGARREIDNQIADVRIETTRETTKNATKIAVLISLAALLFQKAVGALFSGRLWE